MLAGYAGISTAMETLQSLKKGNMGEKNRNGQRARIGYEDKRKVRRWKRFYAECTKTPPEAEGV